MPARVTIAIFAVLVALTLGLAPLAAQQDPAPSPPADQPAAAEAPAADPATETAAPLARAAAFPYVATVSGDRVNIRSGPAEVYYDTARLDPGQQVVVLEELHGWAKIAPTAQCFSYIHRDFVRILGPVGDASGAYDSPFAPETDEPTDESAPADHPLLGRSVLQGVVTGDRVRVRAGSARVSPANANEVQVLLNEGDVVRVLGRRDDFYTIQCPKGAAFWVSLDFLKRQGPLTPELREELSAAASSNVANTATAHPGRSVPGQDRQDYEALVARFNQELLKPMEERTFEAINGELQELRERATTPSVRNALDAFEQQVVRSEAAIDIYNMSRRQDEQLQQTLNRIQQQMESLDARAAVREKPKYTVVTGEIQPSAVFPPDGPNPRYLVVDRTGRISHYAVPSETGPDLYSLIGRQVTMLGAIEYDAFSDSKILHVVEINPDLAAPAVEGAPEPAAEPSGDQTETSETGDAQEPAASSGRF